MLVMNLACVVIGRAYALIHELTLYTNIHTPSASSLSGLWLAHAELANIAIASLSSLEVWLV
jgi:hypothetical protein